MASHSFWRGHKIRWVGGAWIFVDTGEPTVGSHRPCGQCNRYSTAEGHDACLGALPGVSNACCGHGQIRDAYVQMDDGNRLRGNDAAAVFSRS